MAIRTFTSRIAQDGHALRIRDRDRSRWRLVVIAAFVARLAMIYIASIIDARAVDPSANGSRPPFTDVDYNVISDAAAVVWKRWKSPYDRATYRYTPFLSYLLLPNHFIHPLFGKLLFAVADMVVGQLLYVLCQGIYDNPDLDEGNALLYTAAGWMLNPFVISISSRGSPESLLSILVIGSLTAFVKGYRDVSALLLGAATHWKLYPFIHGLALICAIPNHSSQKYITMARIRFAAIAFALFMVLNGIAYKLHGSAFIQNAYLYHASRIDHRHNFSPYFLASAMGSGASSVRWILQLSTTLLLGISFGSSNELPLAFALQTLAFVTFNSVSTAQYFLWYFQFLPLLGKSFPLLPRNDLVLLVSGWIAAHASWLGIAWALEFKGYASFVPLWIASLCCTCAGSAIISECVLGYGIWGQRGQHKGREPFVQEGRAEDQEDMTDFRRHTRYPSNTDHSRVFDYDQNSQEHSDDDSVANVPRRRPSRLLHKYSRSFSKSISISE